jgi:hypothetical protein
MDGGRSGSVPKSECGRGMISARGIIGRIIEIRSRVDIPYAQTVDSDGRQQLSCLFLSLKPTSLSLTG